MRKNNQRGITLVALVITIIILIILAGIGISVVLGENGLIEKAKSGAASYQDESIKEKINLAVISASANSEAKVNENVLKKELNEALGEGKYTYTINENPGEVIVIYNGKEYKIKTAGITTEGDEPKTTTGGISIQDDPAERTDIGSDTSSTEWDDTIQNGQAKLDLGETVNLRLKKVAAMANGVSETILDTWTVYNSEDTYIKAIVWSNSAPTEEQKVKYGQLAMTSESILGMDTDGTTNELIVSEVPIWAWFDTTTGTMYIYSKDTTIDMHPHSERMFQGMKSLETISGLSHFVSSEVTTMRCMFKDTKVSDFTTINGWDVTKVKTAIKANVNLPGNNGFYWTCNNVTDHNHPYYTTVKGWWDDEGTLHKDFKDIPYTIAGMKRNLLTIDGREYIKQGYDNCLAFNLINDNYCFPILVSTSADGVGCTNSGSPYEGIYQMPNGESKTFYCTVPYGYGKNYEKTMYVVTVDIQSTLQQSDYLQIATAVIDSYGADKFFGEFSEWYYSNEIEDYYKIEASDSYYNSNITFVAGPVGAVYDDPDKIWLTESGNYGEHWLKIEFKNPQCIKSYYLNGAFTSSGHLYKFYMQASNDGTNWVNIEGETVHDGVDYDSGVFNIDIDNNTSYKFYRMYFPEGGWASGNSGFAIRLLKLYK